MATYNINRLVAANVLDGILQDIASFKDIQEDPQRNDNLGETAISTLKSIESKLMDAGFTDLKVCDGEEHLNPNIDRCMICTPRWGYVGPRVNIT